MLIDPCVRLFDSLSSHLHNRDQEVKDRGNHHPQQWSPLDTVDHQT